MEQPPKETLRQKDHSARAIWREAPSAPTEGEFRVHAPEQLSGPETDWGQQCQGRTLLTNVSRIGHATHRHYR
jgi:hypothetical protein